MCQEKKNPMSLSPQSNTHRSFAKIRNASDSMLELEYNKVSLKYKKIN